MKLFTKRALIAAAIATTFVGVSVTAVAQNMGDIPADQRAQHMAQRVAAADQAQPRAEHRADRMARMEQRRAEHQARLKADLKLTAEQEPAWNAFVARMQHEPRKSMQGDREAMAKLTTPERLDKMQTMKTERDARMSQRTEAIKSFYSALSPEQQKTFDSQHMGMRHTGMKGEHRMHRQGGDHGQGMGKGMHKGGMGCEGGPAQRS